MADRVTALSGHIQAGHFGVSDKTGVALSEITDLTLVQIAAWPNTLHKVAQQASDIAGCDAAPAPGSSANGSHGSLLRTEPLKWWLYGVSTPGASTPGASTPGASTPGASTPGASTPGASTPGASTPEMDAELGATLDLSHSRTLIRVTGDHATTLLNRHLPLDLREASFPVGSVASTAFHHCGVTLWRTADGYELFLPRGFALSLWELLFDSALQFGVEVS